LSSVTQNTKGGSRKDIKTLMLLCAVVYFCSYLTRLGYAAVMVEMIASEGFTRAGASAAVTALFIAYGAGQIVSGYMGDRMPPEKMIFGGLLVSSGMNLLIPLCPTTGYMTLVWCINGFAQSMMWPPLVRIMAELLSEEDYKVAAIRVNWGSSMGTIVIYLLAPVCITISGWRLLFCFTAGIATLVAFIWIRSYGPLHDRLLEGRVKQSVRVGVIHAQAERKLDRPIFILLGIMMIAIVMQGSLRDGITTWMPSFIAESFDLGSSISILTSVALPIFTICALQAMAWLNKHVFPNELQCAAAIFGTGFAALILLKLFGGSSLLLTVAALTVGCGCMHGVNQILICTVPKFFENTGKISLISGVLNSCTYVGSALSTYGLALVTDAFGWDATVGIWCIAALIGTLCCIGNVGRWKRYVDSI